MDPSSPPAWITHVFGLLPCLPDMNSVQRNYHRVLHAGVGESLEVRVLPFYPIGGAGMHYPRKDADGQPVYPENTREPNRILGRAVNAMFGGDMSAIGEQRRKERQLQMLDLEGEWFDCHDVQGYLEHLGIELGCASPVAERAPTVQLMLSEWMEEPETSTLDVDRFLTCKSETKKSNIRYFSAINTVSTGPKRANPRPRPWIQEVRCRRCLERSTAVHLNDFILFNSHQSFHLNNKSGVYICLNTACLPSRYVVTI